MNLEHIETFLAVIDTGNFREAGRQLGVAQPTVSQHIKKLEDSVGATLVLRDRGGCVAAPNTESFVEYARAILKLAEKARLSLIYPRLTIGASSNIGIYLIQPYIHRFSEIYGRRLDLDVLIERNDVIAKKLDNSEIDVGTMEWWDHRPGYIAQSWYKEPLVVIVPPDHPWTELREINKVDLIGQPIIGGESHTGTGRILRQELGEIIEQLTVAMNLGSTEAVKNAVRAGLGISIVLQKSVADEVAEGHLATICIKDTKLSKELFVIHRRGLPSDSFALRFVNMLLK